MVETDILSLNLCPSHLYVSADKFPMSYDGIDSVGKRGMFPGLKKQLKFRHFSSDGCCGDLVGRTTF